jgi:hypothetical protein
MMMKMEKEMGLTTKSPKRRQRRSLLGTLLLAVMVKSKNVNNNDTIRH